MKTWPVLEEYKRMIHILYFQTYSAGSHYIDDNSNSCENASQHKQCEV